MVILLYVVVLVVASWSPFQPQLPWFERTSPERSSDGPDGGATVAFDGTAILRSDGEPDWVAEARDDGRLTIVVTAATDELDQSGPARVVTLGRDVYAANLTLGQDGDALVVRVRRAGSDATGEPAYVLDGFFERGAARTAEVRIDGARVTVLVDGSVVVDDEVAEPVLAGWAEGHTLSVGDQPGGERGWVGELSQLRVRAGPTEVDLLEPGVLRPGEGRELRARIREDARFALRDSTALALGRALFLVPFGAAVHLASLAAPTRRRRRLLLGLLALPVVLMLGKLVVAGRHPSPASTVLELAGALAGYAAASWSTRRWRPGWRAAAA